MRVRRVVVAAVAAGFVAIVAHAAAVNQCPASELGACARLHLALMRPPAVAPLTLAAAPMRAADRG